jgi:hypothetical protein
MSRRSIRSLWLVCAGLYFLPAPAWAIEPFSDGSSALTAPDVYSGVALGVADMNGDGLDDIVRLDDGDTFQIEFQQPDGTFELYLYEDIGGHAWSMSIGDVDGNGYLDVFAGGSYDDLKLLLANSNGTAYNTLIIPGPQVFVQCSNFADIDNNGTLDLFVCNDDGLSSPFNNDGTGSMTLDTGLINPVSAVPSDNSGNYGTTWTDYDNDGDLDLYLARCRQAVGDPQDGRRINNLYRNDGGGNWTDVADTAGLRPFRQSWSADFGDIDNDGDFDVFLVNHGQSSQLYENMGPGADLGTFQEITSSAGLMPDVDQIGLGIQTHFEDFDNDGFIDLLVTGTSGEHRLYQNDGDKTFTRVSVPFPTGNLGIQSAVVGDLNNDGFPDVVGAFASGFNDPSSGNPDRLFLNPGNDNHWFNVRLTGVDSNRSAVGARVEITGSWGTQIREVRAGESYGITNSLTRHFGLGTADSIDTLTVRWPSGNVDVIDDPPLDATVHVTEGCTSAWFADSDGDGFGDSSTAMYACDAPDGAVQDGTDCADDEPAQFPGNPEVCDMLDNDCNGEVDDGDVCNTGETGETGAGESGADGETGAGGEGDDETGEDGGATDSGAGACGCAVTQPERRPLRIALGLSIFALPLIRRRRR